MTEKQKPKSQSLRSIFEELEKISSWFQREEVDLDEAIEKYKRGLELIKSAEKLLKEAENKLTSVRVLEK